MGSPGTIRNEERQVNAGDAGEQEYDIVPMHLQTTAEMGHQARDLDLTVRRRHGGDGPDCEFGHVGADFVG